jgi:endoribonuclease Dicer
MMNFRKGNVNCLFATSVAEEGLDIPDCNLVIRFDLYTTLIQYIQSKGRARHENSRYIHMCEDQNQNHTNIIREVRLNEHILESFCAALPESRKLMGNDFDMDYFLAKERTHRVYVEPKTGAKLTYKMSLMVLANFVDSLPQSPESILIADYVVTPQNKQFICEVILPEASPIRGAIGRPASTKQVAKCSAAFETCLLLRKAKYLDEWLLPIFTKQLPVMRNALLAVDSKKRKAYDMRTKPALWSVGGVPEELFVTILSLANPESLDRPSQPLALLTRNPLPQLPHFVLHFGVQNSPVLCTSITRPLNVTSTILHQINTFTLCLFEDVFSKEYESNPSCMPYFLAPINPRGNFYQQADPSDMIGWQVLEDVEDYQLRWSENHSDNKSWQTRPDEFFRDRFIIDPFDGSRKLWSIGVAHQYKPLDPVPPNSAPRKGTRKNNDNIMEYSCSLWAKARSRRTFDENQRVIEARFISLRRNLLDEFDVPEEETPKRCFVILEPLKISPVSSCGLAVESNANNTSFPVLS